MSLKSRSIEHWQILILFLLAIAAGTFLWWITPYGVAIDHDSLFYLFTAENIANGDGAYWTGSGGELKPLSHFPPLYPAMLALPILLSFDPVTSARITAAILFGCNVFLVGLILYRYPKKIVLSLIGILWIFLSPVTNKLHLRAMSEPLYFTWMLLSFLFVGEYIVKQKKPFLVSGALVAACAVLTRYTGIVIVGVCALGVLILQQDSTKKRLADTGIFTAIGLLPIGAWMLRNISLTGSATNRTFEEHIIGIGTLARILDVVFDWVTSINISIWLEGAIGLISFLAISLYLYWRMWILGERDRGDVVLPLMFLMVPVIHLFQLIVSLSFFDASTRIDDRILSPIFLSLSLLFFLLLSTLRNSRFFAYLSVGLLSLALLHPLPKMLEESQINFRNIRNAGGGFGSKGWQASDLIGWVRSQEGDTIIVSNQAMAVHFLTNSITIQVPERWDPVKDQEREGYEAQINEVLDLLEKPSSYLVLFKPRDLSNPPDLSWLAGLSLVFQNDEGKIYSGWNAD